MKAKLDLPAAWDKQNGVRPIVRDERGDFICEGFHDKDAQARLQLMVDQSNKYLELKSIVEQLAIVEQLTKVSQDLTVDLQSILGNQDDKANEARKDLSPYEGMYAYTVDGSERYEGNFPGSDKAIEAAISFIDREFEDGESVKFTVGVRVHPFDVTYGNKTSARGLGINIAETVSELCGDTIYAGVDEYPISLNEDTCEEMGLMVVDFMRKNTEVHDYGIMHEVGFTRTSSLDEVNSNAFLNEMESMKSEYIARKNGWLGDGEQIFRGIDGVTDLHKQNTEYANNWQEAVEIDEDRATAVENDDDSQRMF